MITQHLFETFRIFNNDEMVLEKIGLTAFAGNFQYLEQRRRDSPAWQTNLKLLIILQRGEDQNQAYSFG